MGGYGSGGDLADRDGGLEDDWEGSIALSTRPGVTRPSSLGAWLSWRSTNLIPEIRRM